MNKNNIYRNSNFILSIAIVFFVLSYILVIFEYSLLPLIFSIIAIVLCIAGLIVQEIEFLKFKDFVKKNWH